MFLSNLNMSRKGVVFFTIWKFSVRRRAGGVSVCYFATPKKLNHFGIFI